MKEAFLKFSNWIKDHLPTKRRLIQIYAALLFNANVKGYISGRIFTGKTKYACVPGLNCYSCPGAVGSCPLGALQNALSTSETRAPYYVIGILALFGLILGRTICGYLCPVGLGQELLYKIPTPKLKKNKFTRVLSYLKYVILAVFVIILPIMYGSAGIAFPAFCKFICPAGTFGGGLGLLLNPANQDYLNMLGPIFTWKFSLMCVIVAACVFIYRAFCRFLCPLGAIYGFFNRFAFIGVTVDSDNCTDCGLCVSHCKMDIRRVGDHECINCGECISVCPTKAISYKGGKFVLRKNETATAVEPAAEQVEAPAKLSSKIDGFNEPSFEFDKNPTPLALNRLILEGAGIPTPALLPDVGLPDGSAQTCAGQAHTIEDKATADETPEAQTTAQEEQVGEEQFEEIEIAGENDSQSEGEEPVEQFEEIVDDENAQSGDGGKTAPKKESKLKKRPARFYVQMAVAIVLVLALIGVFVYFNAVANDAEVINMEVGDPLPQFALREYKQCEDDMWGLTDDVYDLSAHAGKVTVVNFWATWCTACVAEIPNFERLHLAYPDVNVIGIHGISTDAPKGTPQDLYVAMFIEARADLGWGKITYVQDEIVNNVSMTFKAMGGKDAWPITLIADKDGIVRFIRHGSISYDALEAEVQKLL